jgi:hypothetical protein
MVSFYPGKEISLPFKWDVTGAPRVGLEILEKGKTFCRGLESNKDFSLLQFIGVFTIPTELSLILQ